MYNGINIRKETHILGGRERRGEGEGERGRENDNGRPSEHGWRRWDRVNQSGSIWSRRRRREIERAESSDNRDRASEGGRIRERDKRRERREEESKRGREGE